MIDLGVSETNQAYANSGALQRINLVHKREIAYTESGSMPTDLSRLQNTSDGYLDTVHGLRDTYAADLVELIENSPDYCGIAYEMTDVSPSFAPLAFGITHYSCVSPYYVLAHEMGHNMGLGHDTYVDSNTLPYPYSHGYVNQAAFLPGAPDTKRWRDIMAYNNQCTAAGFGCTTLPFFSNPLITYTGDPMGNASTADAVRSLNNTRSTVASFRSPLPPIQWTSGNGHYYQLFPRLTGFTEAQAAAIGMGGYLATVTSAAENSFIATNFLATGTPLWLGGFQSAANPGYSEPGTGWAWQTAEAFGYTNWNNLEPGDTANPGGIDISGNEDHLGMNASGTWFDINGNIPYSAKMFYVVEWDSVFPAITIQPMGQTIGPGQTATLSVAATGMTLSYQWYVGTSGTTSNPIPGATANSYTTPALTSATSYWVRVSNTYGSADSYTVTVTIGTPPTITTQPAGQTIAPAESATLCVVATGAAPLRYKWYSWIKDTPSLPVQDGPSKCYTTPALTIATNYWVRVSNDYGQVNSNIVTVTVSAPPPTISSLNPSSAINLFPGTGPGTQTLTLTVNGSAFAMGAVVTFDTINTLSTTFNNPSQLTATIPAPNYYLWLSGKHSVQVANPDGGKSNIASFDALPSITSLSPSSANAGGSSFTLTLKATGLFLDAVVNFGGTSLQGTSFLNGQLTRTVPAALITQAGVVNVTITSNGETSGPFPFTVNARPTVATPASASPSPVTATTTDLSVLGADDAGEPNLVYTWATTGTPPAALTFSANGTNAAKNMVATFRKAGNYNLRVTIKDQGGLTVTSSVNVTVNQTLTSLTVAPTTATVVTGGTQQFTPAALDQFKTAMSSPPSFQWTAFGGGTISGTGLFRAGNTLGGPFAISVVAGGGLAVATVTVIAPPVVAYVQGANITSDSAASSIARAFTTSNTAGNLIIAAVSWGNSGGVRCSDSQGNAYAVATTQTDSVYNQSLAICYAPNVKGGANTVTATFSGAPVYRRLLIQEYQGIALGDPVDVVAMNVANGTTATNGITSTSAVTTSSGDLIFGAVIDAFDLTSITAGTGFTQRQSNNIDMATEDLVQVASGSIAATQTFGVAHRYLAQMVAFKQR